MSFSPFSSSSLQPFSPQFSPMFNTPMPGMGSIGGPMPTFGKMATGYPPGGDSFTYTDRQITGPIKPDRSLKHFSELTPENLKKIGLGNVQGMVFDIDDTLSKYKLGERSIPKELKTNLKALQDSGIQLGIVTNNPSKKTAQQFKDELKKAGVNVEVIYHAKKPSPKGLEMMQEKFGLSASQMMMVGDQSTDVESGMRAGFKTAQVDWFGNSKLHQKLMHTADEALATVDSGKATFDTDPDQPEFLPSATEKTASSQQKAG